MTDNQFLTVLLIGIFIGVVTTAFVGIITHKDIKLEMEANHDEAMLESKARYEEKLSVKEIQVGIIQASYKECRSIIKELTPVVEPRPIAIE